MGDIKRHWAVIKQVTNKTNNKDEVTTGFYYSGKWVENDQENADNFNDFYAKVGKETNQSVGQSTNDAQHYLNKHVRTRYSLVIFSPRMSLMLVKNSNSKLAKTEWDYNKILF